MRTGFKFDYYVFLNFFGSYVFGFVDFLAYFNRHGVAGAVLQTPLLLND